MYSGSTVSVDVGHGVAGENDAAVGLGGRLPLLGGVARCRPSENPPPRFRSNREKHKAEEKQRRALIGDLFGALGRLVHLDKSAARHTRQVVLDEAAAEAARLGKEEERLLEEKRAEESRQAELLEGLNRLKQSFPGKRIVRRYNCDFWSIPERSASDQGSDDDVPPPVPEQPPPLDPVEEWRLNVLFGLVPHPDLHWNLEL